MYKATELFFQNNLSQKDIAIRLNISPVTVCRIIQRAKELEIVKFQMQDDVSRILDLSHRLQNKYKLDEVIIAPYPNKLHPQLQDKKHAVALEGARYLQRIIKPNDIIGIAWGKTMYYLINYLNPCQRTNASFITMHGRISSCDFDLDVQTLTSRAAMALGGKKYCLFSNGLLDDSDTVKQLKKEQNVRQIFDMYEKITISISGIGVHYPKSTSLLTSQSYMPADDYSTLLDAGMCGDIMLRFFDKTGCECNTPIKDRTMAIDLELYKKIPKKILAVAGEHKAYTLEVAVKSGLCDVMIISEDLANLLV